MIVGGPDMRGMTADEQALRATTPVYVNSYNQPSYVRQMVEGLLSNGFGRIVVCDNASTSPKTRALLSRFEAEGRVQVRHLGGNLGPHRVVMQLRAAMRTPFLFSDPDLRLPEVLPDRFVTRLLALSRRYRCAKVGLALEIPPEAEARDLRFDHPVLGPFKVSDWERQFWKIELEPGVYRANVDTTFFLWNPAVRFDWRRLYNETLWSLKPRRIFGTMIPLIGQADIRVAEPGFVARHLPWYRNDEMPEDERAFYKQSASSISTWFRSL